MKVEVEIDEKDIHDLITKVIVTRGSKDIYKRCSQVFLDLDYRTINNKLNNELKKTVEHLVSEKFANWENSKNESLDEYLDRRLEEAIDNIDFEKLFKEKLIK